MESNKELLEKQLSDFTKEQMQKMNEFEDMLSKDYAELKGSIDKFTGNYNNAICGIDIMNFRGAWDIKFKFDNGASRIYALS